MAIRERNYDFLSWIIAWLCDRFDANHLGTISFFVEGTHGKSE
jgi:hypothetical protein